MVQQLQSDVKVFLLGIGESASFVENLQIEDYEQYLSSKAFLCHQMRKTSELNTLLARLVAYSLSRMFAGDFVQTDEEIVPASEISHDLEVIVWSDEAYIIKRDNGEKTRAYYFDGSLATNNFIPLFEGEPHFSIGRVTEEFFNQVRSEFLS